MIDNLFSIFVPHSNNHVRKTAQTKNNQEKTVYKKPPGYFERRHF